MGRFGDASGSVRAFVLAAVFLLLFFGLCGVGAALDGNAHASLGQFALSASGLCFVGFVLSLLTGIILAIAEAIRAKGRRNL